MSQTVVITGASAGIGRATARTIGQRGQYWVGDSTAWTILAQKVAAPLLDRYLAKTGYDSQQTGEQVAPGRPANLWEPVDGRDGTDHGAHGTFGSRSHSRSPELWASQHRGVVSALTGTVAAAAAGAALAARPGRRR